jgi:alpha-amylase
VRAETNKPKMFAVGEYWHESLDALEAYLDGLGTQVSENFCFGRIELMSL